MANGITSFWLMAAPFELKSNQTRDLHLDSERMRSEVEAHLGNSRHADLGSDAASSDSDGEA